MLEAHRRIWFVARSCVAVFPVSNGGYGKADENHRFCSVFPDSAGPRRVTAIRLCRHPQFSKERASWKMQRRC